MLIWELWLTLYNNGSTGIATVESSSLSFPCMDGEKQHLVHVTVKCHPPHPLLLGPPGPIVLKPIHLLIPSIYSSSVSPHKLCTKGYITRLDEQILYADYSVYYLPFPSTYVYYNKQVYVNTCEDYKLMQT